MKIKKPEIKTKRLLLKAYGTNDRDRLVEILMNKEIQETFMIPDYSDVNQYYELADRLIKFSEAKDEEHLEYGIFHNEVLIGFLNDCGFDDEKIEIGYVIAPEYKNQGFATEALINVIEFLKEMGFKKIVAGFFEENGASRKVMEKCGMYLTDKTDVIEYRGKKHKCLYCEMIVG